MRSIDAFRAQLAERSLHAYDRLSDRIAGLIARGIDGVAAWAAGLRAAAADRLRAGLAAWRDGSAVAALRARLDVSPAMLLVDWLRARIAGAAAAATVRWRRLAADIRSLLPGGN